MERPITEADLKSEMAVNANVKPYQIGLVVWAQDTAEATLKHVTDFGLHAAQLGIPPAMDCTAALPEWKAAHAGATVALTSAVVSYAGEDYSNLERVHESVGFTAPQYRAERIARTKEVAAFAHQLGIGSLSCHIGFIPSDPADHLYDELLAVTRELCDACDELGQTFALETGQESAAVLVGFLSDLDRPNCKVNFDPANMVLYGSGDPVNALSLLRSWVISVHFKDGTLPPSDGQLGKEVRLGDGAVDFPAFIHMLKEMHYKGTFTIEREEQNGAVRDSDVRTAMERINHWKVQAGL